MSHIVTKSLSSTHIAQTCLILWPSFEVTDLHERCKLYVASHNHHHHRHPQSPPLNLSICAKTSKEWILYALRMIGICSWFTQWERMRKFMNNIKILKSLVATILLLLRLPFPFHLDSNLLIMKTADCLSRQNHGPSNNFVPDEIGWWKERSYMSNVRRPDARVYTGINFILKMWMSVWCRMADKFL